MIFYLKNVDIICYNIIYFLNILHNKKIIKENLKKKIIIIIIIGT